MRWLITILMMVMAQIAVADDVMGGMVDPTKPPASVMDYFPNAQAQTEGLWELTAIQENGKAGFAVVNGQMVQVGGNYEGFKLTSVKNRQAVFISKAGEKKVVGMGLSSFMEHTTPQASVKKDKQAKRVKKPGQKIAK
ncbi:hypothetical protein [Methylophilus sp. QUAN]|uniref:hypothetical protein n=1 Tax=Methylophilus sp. QUAN TaxID=2781020 RepID=UPI00188FA47C|nr:hypothetical protein [Methylophilus sp. QUAN]MBF4990024.1 hypothetical protein [Methylophilus sp. QUAN]